MQEPETFWVIRRMADGKFFARSIIAKMEYVDKIGSVPKDARCDTEEEARRRYEAIVADCVAEKHKYQMCRVNATYLIDEKGRVFETLPKGDEAQLV